MSVEKNWLENMFRFQWMDSPVLRKSQPGFKMLYVLRDNFAINKTSQNTWMENVFRVQ